MQTNLSSPHREVLIQTRTTLLFRLKNWQDNASWQEFFDTYWKLVYNVARKTGLSDSEAQDVVQETLIAVAKSIPDFQYKREIGSFKGWLLKLTRWRIVDQFRKRKKSGLHPNNGIDIFPSRETVDHIPDPASEKLNCLWDEEWQNTLLTTALVAVRRRLSPRQYQIFDFYVNKNWPAEKVAMKLKLSVDQVYMAKYRVTEMIRQEVKSLQAKFG